MPLYASFLRENIADLQLKAVMAASSEAKNHREVSEAYEMVANFEFYSAKYSSAVLNYEEAFFHRHFFPTDRENPMLCIMVAVCYFNLNNFSKAYCVLERAVEQARLADAKDLECIAVSNMAVIEHSMLRQKAALDKSTEALTMVNELPLTHPQLDNTKYSMDHKRIYVGILIRSGSYGQAEMSIKEFQFSEKETAVLTAGCKFLSGQFESAKNILEACASRINDDGSMSALPRELKRHSSNMYERTSVDLDEEEQTMLAALVLYNLAVMYCNSGRYADSISLFDRATHVLGRICILPNQSASKKELADRFKMHASSKFLLFNIQRSLDAASIDSFLAPATLLSQCTSARAEASFLNSELAGATDIQLGNMLPSDKKGALTETEKLSNELNDAFRSYLDSHPNLEASLMPDDVFTAKRGTRGSGLLLTTPLLPQGTPGVDSSPDLLRAQEVLGPFRRLLGACSGGKSATAVTTETINTMKMVKHASRSAASTATKSTRTPGSTGSTSFVLPKLSNAEKMLEPTEESTTRAPGFEAALKALPKCSNSVRASMLVVPESFQPRSVGSGLDLAGSRGGSRQAKSKTGGDPDQYAASVVEWALMICEGASLGMIGLPMVNMPKDYSDRRRDKERDRIKAEAKGAREKLQECLQKEKPTNPAVLMSVYSTLAKLCMNLGLRTDAGANITLMEEMVIIDNQKRPTTLAKKFRADYEEWLADATTPSTAPSQVRLKRVQQLLVHIKAYYESAKDCGDLNLLRDACKRMMNIYIDISGIPDPLGTPPREMGTVEELMLFTDVQVNSNEQKDILWLKLFSKARALVFLRELKAAGKSPEELQPEVITAIANRIEGNNCGKAMLSPVMDPSPVKAVMPPGMSFGFDSFSSIDSGLLERAVGTNSHMSFGSFTNVSRPGSPETSIQSPT